MCIRDSNTTLYNIQGTQKSLNVEKITKKNIYRTSKNTVNTGHASRHVIANYLESQSQVQPCRVAILASASTFNNSKNTNKSVLLMTQNSQDFAATPMTAV